MVGWWQALQEEEEQGREKEAMRTNADEAVDVEQELESDGEEPRDLDAQDLMELLIDTDDEAGVELPAGRHSRVKSFMHRPSYALLARHGLAEIPTSTVGVSIGYHRTSQCWQAFCPGVRTGLSYSWGGTTHRTETEALIKCIKGLLTAYIEKYPRENLWKLGCETLLEVDCTCIIRSTY